MNCYCFLLPTFTYITLLSLQKEGESQVSSHFFVSPTKLTGLSMFFCNTCYLIATRYPCREKISGKERRALELQHDIKMHIRNIFFMRRRKHLPNADWILLTPLFSCITDSPLGVSEALWTKAWRKYFEIFEIIASIGRKYSETYYSSSQVT